MKRFKKALSLTLTIATTLSVTTFPAFASVYSDTTGHWGEQIIDKWSSYGVLQGNGDGTFAPNRSMTVGELAVALTKSFGYPNGGGDYLDAAVAAGVIDRKDAGTKLTRELAAKIVSNAFNAPPISGETQFADNAKVSAGYKPYVNAAGQSKTFVGDTLGGKGAFRPQDQLTRAEMMAALNNAASDIVKTSGSANAERNLIVNVPGVTLKDGTTKGDLIAGQGVGDGDLTLDGVTVNGRFVVLGGGESSIRIRGGSRIPKTLTNKRNGAGQKVRVVVEDAASQVGEIDVVSGSQAVLQTENGASIDKVGVVQNITVDESAGKIILAQESAPTNVGVEANVGEIAITAANSKVELTSAARVGSIISGSTATNAAITVNNGATVTELQTAGADVSVASGANVRTIVADGAASVNVASGAKIGEVRVASESVTVKAASGSVEVVVISDSIDKNKVNVTAEGATRQTGKVESVKDPVANIPGAKAPSDSSGANSDNKSNSTASETENASSGGGGGGGGGKNYGSPEATVATVKFTQSGAATTVSRFPASSTLGEDPVYEIITQGEDDRSALPDIVGAAKIDFGLSDKEKITNYSADNLYRIDLTVAPPQGADISNAMLLINDGENTHNALKPGFIGLASGMKLDRFTDQSFLFLSNYPGVWNIKFTLTHIETEDDSNTKSGKKETAIKNIVGTALNVTVNGSEDITRPGDYKVAGIVNFVTGGCAVKTGNANSHEWKNVTGKTANLFRAIYEPNKPGYSTTAGKPAASAHDLTDEESASVLSLFTVRLGNTEEDDVIEISDSDSSEISGPLFVNLGYPTVADNSFLPDFVITPENIGASHSYEDVTFLVNNGTYLNIDSDQKTEGITGGDYEPGTASSSFAGSILVRNGGRARVSAWNAWPFVDDSNVIVSAGGYLALGQGDRSGAIATDALESHTDLQDYYNGWFVGTSDNDKIRLNSPNSYIALNETSILLDGDATVNNDVSIARSFYLTGASTLTIADGVRFTFGNDLNYNQYTTKAFYGQPGAQIVISSDASVVDDSADNPSFGSSTTPVSTSTWIATNSSEEEPSWDTTLYGGTFYSSWSEQQENQVGENDPSTMEELVG